ncbi:MAG: PhzF family phenazine biosynthesis protein [Candidatus Bipolaricaulota bacterium]
MKIPIYQVDAFTEEPFRGNPAAVCPIEEWPEDRILQSIAAENNLSETAFFVESSKSYELRWFTPQNEVDLCGHGTLAAAFVLFEELGHGQRAIKFETQSGQLQVQQERDYFSMNFPSRPPVPTKPDQNIIDGLGIEPLKAFESRDFMAVYDSQEQIRALDPDMKLLEKGAWSGVIATAEGREKGVDFVSRFFAPAEGIPEDPVTGSAHCTLAPYWSDRLCKTELKARQLSRRGGTVLCEMKENRVKIMGSAALYMKGELHLDGY